MTARDTLVGLALAALVIGSWGAGLVAWLTVVDWGDRLWAMPFAIALQCWLYVGLFIVAHDAMHGTLAPAAPRLGHAIGALCVALYAAFDYRALKRAHHAHHRHAGTAQDPDFHPEDPRAFWAWYAGFFRHYFTWTQFWALGTVGTVSWFALGERAWLLGPFWLLPSLLSSLQLFYFGTYRPHRHEEAPFTDGHNARSLDQSWLVSLLSCFHFGHHHTHHDRPQVPWWRLPAASRKEIRP